MTINPNFTKLMLFLSEKGIDITLTTKHFYNHDTEESTNFILFDLNSGAKSDFSVLIPETNTLTIKARYNVDHVFEITDNVDDYIHELLLFFRDNIMYYPNKDFCNCNWYDLMKEYGVI